MKNKTLMIIISAVLVVIASCAQQNKTVETAELEVTNPTTEKVESEPHRYGGWYCPDNLNGFPAVDIADWNKVPVVNGRMATEEETQNGTALIFVDLEKYPNAKPLDIEMPQLASFYNRNTGREDLIIIIQALNIDNDSIIGYRFLNGGNGSGWLDEVTLLSNKEAQKIPSSRFVAQTIEITASQNKIWEVLTNPENARTLQPFFDTDKQLKKDWRETTNVNYNYSNAGALTAEYADLLYGCFYVENSYDKLSYTEKFLLIENQETGITELKISCGPYADDYEVQKSILINWGQKVKELSEK